MLNADQLESEIRQGIPLAEQMAFRISELSPNAIKVVGGGRENVNVHGTAFAGSLYAVSTLALWGLIRARLPDNTTLVLAAVLRIAYVFHVALDAETLAVGLFIGLLLWRETLACRA